MLSIKFGDTGFSLLTVHDEKKQKVFVVFYNGEPIAHFANESEARSFIWAEYKKMLNLELAEEEEKQAKLAFFNKKEEEDKFDANLKEALYRVHLDKGLFSTLEPTPAPAPKSTRSGYEPN